ncbi:AAA family ATPase [Mesorhizobium sp. KR1-2]|uniref:bifunctional aminoglycoside phosphotransferase/ATP-binding protein n=1 Tax=Mesorhizobium sp. KR1-2 TaxID=3156609 RepID=UPI0032B3A7A5
MIVDDQSQVIAFLKEPRSYGIDSPVEVMETHISLIFLAGDRAFKMKRAVKLPYVDFSTPELRLAACEKEVALNSATAPGLYLGVRRIGRNQAGELAFTGDGETLDAVVEMVRFDQECLFDRMAMAGALTPQLMTEVARTVARFHEQAPIAHVGGPANMQAVLDINEAGFATSHVFRPEEVSAFVASFQNALARCSPLLDDRVAKGRIRRCHGDLHLRNICLFGGEPRLFDCIEFNDQIATVDVLYDLAFLLMDLWHRGLPHFANLVMNRYLDETDNDDGFPLLPFFMAVRAAVRAHVTATQVEESDAASEELVARARSYFELALSLLVDSPPHLVAIGGLSGSGKSTVAEVLAPWVGPPPGARILESDRIRKAMFGVSPETRLDVAAYQPDVSAKVYWTLCDRARAILAAGGSVVADAVFDRPDNRLLIETAARQGAATFTGVWLEADTGTLLQRVRERVRGPSDATVEVLQGQLGRSVGELGWQRVAAVGPPSSTADKILSLGSAHKTLKEPAPPLR